MTSVINEKLTGLKSDLKTSLAATNQRKGNEQAIYRLKKHHHSLQCYVNSFRSRDKNEEEPNKSEHRCCIFE